jgi:small subunit ribosomal protein S17
VQRSRKFKAHDEANTCKVGDKVQIMECRPLSRTKKFRVVRVIARAS